MWSNTLQMLDWNSRDLGSDPYLAMKLGRLLWACHSLVNVHYRGLEKDAVEKALLHCPEFLERGRVSEM